MSADDSEVIEFSQQAFESKPFHRAVAELGGKGVENTEHMVTEALFHDPYNQRHVVGAPVVREVVDGRIRSEANDAVFRICPRDTT